MPGSANDVRALNALPLNLPPGSEVFSFDFKVEKVPEPTTTIGLGVVAILALYLSRQRKRIGNERMK